MEFQLRKIQLHELEAFTQSSVYQSFDVIPISTNRIRSYIKNPRANPSDFVMYLLFDNAKLIGFRTLFADSITIHGKTERFAWLSGSWVHPSYRRKGIATKLLNELFVDWEGKIMYTNYAPNSKALYDKSEKFDLFTEKHGQRYYLRFHNAFLLKNRNVFFNHVQFALKPLDYALNFLFAVYYQIQKIRFAKSLVGTEFYGKSINEDTLNYMNLNPGSVFLRAYPEYNWIFNFPWITKKNNDQGNYPFSSHAESFYYKTLMVKKESNLIEGLALLKNRNGAITIPYFHSNPDALKTLSQAIIAYGHKTNANSVTFYQPEIIGNLNKMRGLALFKKPMHQKYFISKTLKSKLNITDQSLLVQDGDGDCIFT